MFNYASKMKTVKASLYVFTERYSICICSEEIVVEADNTGNLNRSLFPSCVLLHIQELMCTGAAWITSCSEYKNKGT